MDKSFERKYAINIARLGPGKHIDDFELKADFFRVFENADILNANIAVDIEMEKYETHLDMNLRLAGEVTLACDRCSEPYNHLLETHERIIYSFEPDLDFEGYEVMYTDRMEPQLVLVQELYDFVNMAIPIRRVPEISVHICAPEVLELLGLDAQGDPIPPDATEAEEEDSPADPRWEKLRQLKDKLN